MIARYDDEGDGENTSRIDFEPSAYMPTTSARQSKVTVISSSAADDTQTALETPPTVAIHQPNIGYSVLALVIGLVAMLLCTAAVLAVAYKLHIVPSLTHLDPATMPKTSILGEALGYGICLAIIVPLFRRMWNRPFAQVLQMNLHAARTNAGKLVLLGILLSIIAQAAESLLTLPKDVPLDAFFRTPSDIWTVAIFGTLVAPPVEELLFRGFFLPAFAIAFDWLRLPRTFEARLAWHSTNDLSRAGLVFSGILTSVLFGVMHAAQLKFAWNAVALLSCVGGIFALVRLRFNSVWASSFVHMVYNGFIFVLLFIGTDGFRHLDKLHGH